MGTLLACGAAPGSIGVVTPYEGQRACIEAVLAASAAHTAGVEVASVDAFQGREKDFIVFSCVRTSTNIGFLSDPRRLNVALTRARLGVVVIGNAPSLLRAADPLWRGVISHYRQVRGKR